MTLLLHPTTRGLLANVAQDIPQALLLTGPEGTGKRHVAATWLHESLDVHPTHIHIVAPLEKKSLTVSQVRDLYHTTRTKQYDRQFFILDGAGTMSHGAQNAFLKLLEEPNSAIYFILTANNPEDLLPTIRSRVQHIPIAAIADQDIVQHIQLHFQHEAATVQQIAFIARGRAGLATQLAADQELLAVYKNLATQAKELLTSSPFERLVLLNAIGDRAATMTFLEIAAHMAAMLLGRATSAKDQQLWVNCIEKIHETLERLQANANVKIQLTRLALGL